MMETHLPERSPHIHVQAKHLQPGMRLLCSDGDYHTVINTRLYQPHEGSQTITILLDDWPSFTVGARSELVVSQFVDPQTDILGDTLDEPATPNQEPK